MTIDPREFRAALGCFVTGVAVVTARAADGTPMGLTVNSVTSVSLEPPLVLFCLGRQSQWFERFRDAGHFAVNILREDQRHLSVRFSQPHPDRWDGVDSETWTTGAPIIKGTVATIDCVTEAVHEGGDHLIMVGRVLRLAADPVGRPLVYHAGRYANLA
ncbi:flavin reductase family protein [Arenibaculum pallidiluteum]|uniref:flavin reductase family protein n=1 Tax=Arenibaculum pallidiluteum TaxID=2812559 RepID=UPI001A95D159|nr:flavin reductase family protein [Arenibaculum pallidiluteum]